MFFRLNKTFHRRGINNPAFLFFLFRLRRSLRDHKTVLDVGCGSTSAAQFLDARRTGVDGHAPTVEAARKNGTHDEVRLMDIRNIASEFTPDSFEAVMALDVIEHLPKEEGFKLLKDMESIASRTVVIFTPNGFMPQSLPENDLQTHLSGWETDEFRGIGYKVYGMHGWKWLRDGVELRFRPKAFWAVVSLLTQLLFAYWFPATAASILAVKTKKPSSGTAAPASRER